jgi:uncharacterized protein YhbP (UPF0306 family)
MGEPGMDAVRAFLGDHTTLALATLGNAGEPQSADLYYALLDGSSASSMRDGLRLCFISTRASRHAANIERDPRIACTIHAAATHWRDIRGVQMEGTCARLSGADSTLAWTRYVARFRFVLTDALLGAALATVAIYGITPHWLRWIDNSVRLGHQVEYQL